MTEDTGRAAPHADLLSRDGAAPDGEELDRLRRLLFGRELRDLAELRRRLDGLHLTPEELAEQLPAAVALRTERDKQLARALAPTLDDAFDEAVQRNPDKITTAIFPIIGPAIRKAIAETMAGLVQTINRAIEHSLSWRGIGWRLEAWRTGVPYGEIVIKRALVYRVERIFLIHNDTGLLLGHVTAEGLETPDPDVISGMLTAIKDFIQDSFHAENTHGVRRVSVAEHTIHAQQGPHAMVGAVVRGHPPESLNARLMAILERVHLRFGRQLAAFDGDAAPFAGATSLLEEGLETVVRTDERGGRGSAARVAWAVAGAAVLAAGAWLALESLRWRRAIQALQDTPGIMVVDADRRIGRNRIAGLRDPAAPSPAALLAAHGIDTLEIDGAWETYLSADSSVVRRRIEAAVGTAEGVAWRATPDGWRAEGRAPAAWLRGARRRARSVTGVAALHVDGVALALPDSLIAWQAEVARTRIMFGVGSSVPLPAMADRLDALAASLRAAASAAEADSLTLVLTITGRTDTSGTETANAVLSRRRADAVQAALATRGVPALMRAEGIGTRSPVAAEDALAADELNRSVSFALGYALRDAEGETRE